MGLSIRWPAAARGAAVAIGGLMALAVLQAVLKPQAPPLPADVGLPPAAPPQPATSTGRRDDGGGHARAVRGEGSGWQALRRIANRKSASRGRGGTGDPRRPAGRPRAVPSGRKTPVPLPPPVPAPATPPDAPAPTAPPILPSPAPPPPNDGSIEFAPH